MKNALALFALVLFVSSVVAQETSMVEPKIVRIPQAAMPKEAAESGLGGKVRVQVRIDSSGNVTAADMVSGPDSVCSTVTRADVVALREAARAAAMDAKYEPNSAGTAWLTFDFPRDQLAGASVGAYNAAAVNEESGKESASPAPRDPNKFTVKGDLSPGTAGSPPPDYTGPVNTGGSGRPLPGTISGGVLNGKATTLVKPPYPAAARAVQASGAVSVKVLIDEAGKVWSASAVSGHPLLRAASVGAACQSEFSPVLLSGNPVKVTGIITYNFVP